MFEEDDMFEVIVDIQMQVSRERIIQLLDKSLYILQCQMPDGTWVYMAENADIDVLINKMTFTLFYSPLD